MSSIADAGIREGHVMRHLDIPPYLVPRVWKVLRAAPGKQLVQLTSRQWAVGSKLRTGDEIPRMGIQIFGNYEAAEAAYNDESEL